MRRPRFAMPADVADALRTAKVEGDYAARPAYQRNDYIMWINKAATDATRTKRIAQMTNELKRGGVYMRMKHAPSAKTAGAKSVKKKPAKRSA